MSAVGCEEFISFQKRFSGGSRMVYRPFRSIGRFVLAACAVGFGAASLGAQTPTTKPAVTYAGAGVNPSRADIFAGFSYFGAHGKLQPDGIPYSSIDRGGIASGAYFLNKYFGGEFVYPFHPSGANDGASGPSVGPIVRLPMEHFTLFAHGLAGAERLGGPNSDNPATLENEPYRWGVALTAGGGMDYDLPWFNHQLGLRLFEADYRYIHEDYGPIVAIPTTGTLGGRANLNALELSTGILFHIGNIYPPPPVTYSCAVSPASGYPGDPFTVTGTAGALDPKKMATYTWTSTGGTITGTTSTAMIATTNTAPGTYTASGHVTQGDKPWQSADCTTAQFTVMPFQPPTISCSANPSSVNPGDSSTITSMAMSPQNRPLTYSYSSTAGTVSGTTTAATLSTVGAAPGPITVTCNTVDDKGNSASATTSVVVIAPPPPPVPPAPTTSSLCSVGFERDMARPTRVDNEAKACLDDIALKLQSASDAKLALVADEDAKEQKIDARDMKMHPKHPKPSFAAERAVNTKDYLVTEKGIDPSRVSVYTGASDDKTVSTTLIPAGATLDTTGDTAVDESAVKAVPRNPVPMKKKVMRKKTS
jgi:hypothetical protein